MAMVNSPKDYLSIIATTMILSASIALVTFGIFENAGIAQGQGSNITLSPPPSLTPQQKAAMCNPSDKFINDTESTICGIPPTPTNITTSAANRTSTNMTSTSIAPSAIHSP